MKPVILVFTPHYLPGYRAGGPIRTIANMVDRLGDEFDFRIVTSDRDLGDSCPYPDVQANSWIPCGKATVQYVSRIGFGFRQIAEILRGTPHDLIYLNSFFDPSFTQQVLICRRLGRSSGRPTVIAPRGEFSPGALRIKSRKKSLYIWLARLLKLYDDLTWQASSAQEAEDIRRALPATDSMGDTIMVARNLADPAVKTEQQLREKAQRSVGQTLRVCFLSRVSPKKNLEFSLRLLEHVRVPVIFSIYGPIEDAAYWTRCQTLIANLPSNVEVVYEGPVEPCDVVQTLKQHDLFLFPTRGENFGHVIHEALRAGLPLLISDQTPWRHLEGKGVGWDLPLDDSAAFVRRIEEVAAWSAAQYRRSSEQAQAIAIRTGEDPDTLEANRNLFLNAIDKTNETNERISRDGESHV